MRPSRRCAPSARRPHGCRREPRHGRRRGLGAPRADEDPEAVAGAVLRLLRDPDLRHSIGEGGRARVRSEFDLVRVAAQLGALYRRRRDGAGRA